MVVGRREQDQQVIVTALQLLESTNYETTLQMYMQAFSAQNLRQHPEDLMALTKTPNVEQPNDQAALAYEGMITSSRDICFFCGGSYPYRVPCPAIKHTSSQHKQKGHL